MTSRTAGAFESSRGTKSAGTVFGCIINLASLLIDQPSFLIWSLACKVLKSHRLTGF